MRVLVYFPFVACAIGIAGARPVARRTAPHLAARVLAATGIVLALTTAAALSLLAFTVLARIPFVAAHGHWASSAVARKVNVPEWVGVLALVCIVAIAGKAIRTLDEYRRGLARAFRLQLASSGQIVTVADHDSFAYACRAWPFRPGVIVVSAGLQQTLDAEQRAAVLAHEHSHLRHQHNLYQLVALLTRVLNPLLQPIEHELSFSLERWADEDAAAAQGREVTASALALSALNRGRPTPEPALAHATNGAPARVRALLNPHQHNRVLMAAAAVNAILATLAVLLAAHSTELIFEAIRR